MPDIPSPVSLSNLQFSWPKARFAVSVNAFDLGSGETVLLTGASGAGKSTLLALICGLVQPQAGEIRLLGADITKLQGRARDRLRADLFGIIFQQFNLLPYASALDNICLPLRFSAARRRRVSDPTVEARALAAALGLSDNVLDARAAELSVGQQQRIAVARAMLGDPPIIVADEPTSALDPATQEDFLDVLFRQVDQRGASLLMVSHDPSLSYRFDRVVPLETLTILRQEGA